MRKQLDVIRPAKRERQLHSSLVDFRNSVEKILPLVRSLAALNDPVTLPEVTPKRPTAARNRATPAKISINVVCSLRRAVASASTLDMVRTA